MIETRKLQQFTVVAEELNFRRAAERLHMAQPPLSAAIRQLEAALGVTLFERSKTLVRITPAGSVYLRECYRILDALENATRLVQSASAGALGNIRLAFEPSAGYSYIPALVRTFARDYSQIAIHLDEGNAFEVLRALQAGEADVGFIRQAPGRRSQLIHTVCQEESLCAVVPAAHRLATCATLSVADLADEDFVVVGGMGASGFRAATIETCMAAGFTPRIRYELSTVSTMAGLVAENLGVSLIHEAATRLQHPGVKFLPLVEGAIRIQLLAVWKKAPRDSIVTNLVECVHRMRNAALGDARVVFRRQAVEQAPREPRVGRRKAV